MVGREISHYRVIERLGAGGMGVVYKAHDTSLGRYVALKFLPSPVIDDSQVLERFLREARAAAALNHPNICTIYEVSGNPPDPFIAMEYLEGKTLRDRISGHALPQDLFIELATQLADGLAAAHDRHIIHRDIKPANVFITKNDQAKILDFGLAKITLGRGSQDEQTTFAGSGELTNPGTTVGTVSFMSPEQARGEELDHRSDIFSLGTVLYEMASGKQAFEGNTAAVIFNAILSHQPTPLQQLNPGLSPEVIRIINRCLEKNRELRYQNASDLRSELKRLKRDSDSQSFAASASGLTAAMPRQGFRYTKIATVTVIVALVIASAVFVPGFLGTADKMTESDVIVLTDFANTTGDPMFDGTLKQALAVKLAESPFLNVFSDQQIRETLAFMRRAPDEKLTPDLGREICQRRNLKAMMNPEIASLGSQYVITLRALNCDSGDVLAQDQVQAASKEDVLRAVGDATMHMREKLGESLRSIQRMNTPIDQATTSSLEALKAFTAAEIHRGKGSDQEAIPLYKRAIELDPMFTVAYGRLGVINNNRGEREEAVRLVKKAYELRDRVSERERLYVTAHYNRIVEGDTEKAIATYKLWRQTYPRDFIPATNLGNIYLATGRHKDALAPLEESIQLNPSPQGFSNLVSTYRSLGELDKAVATIKTWSEKLPLDGNPHIQLSGHLRSTGQYDLGLASAQKALELERVPQSYLSVIVALIDLNRIDEAKATAERAIPEKLDNADTHYYLWLMAWYRGDIAGVAREREYAKGKNVEPLFIGFEGAQLAGDGRLREGRVLLERSMAMAKKVNPGSEGRFLTTEASIHATFGNHAKAAESARKALTVSRAINVLADVARIFAVAGDDKGTSEILSEVSAKVPNDVRLQKGLLPAIRSTLALSKKQSEEALNLIKDTAPFVDTYFDYLRGLAQAQAGRHSAAIGEFQKIIDKPGVAIVSNMLIYRMAHLSIARSYSASGDMAKAREAYEKFLGFFPKADPDLPLINDARAELAKLQGS